MNSRTFLISGTVFCALAVVLGALGAHFLRKKMELGFLTEYNLHSFDRGVTYQMYHGIALILVFLLQDKISASYTNPAGWLFFAGIICFSFSIYFLSTKGLTGFSNLKFLGPVTPVGGLLFIAGWITLLTGAFKTLK